MTSALADPGSDADLKPTEPDIDPRLARWSKRMDPVIIVAAILPIVVAVAPRHEDDPFVIINIVSWIIFLADLLVHLRFRKHYLRTGLGKFDLVIVILTFPWYLIPGFGNAAVLGLARLGRVLRLILASGSSDVLRRLTARLGKAGLYSLALIVVCSEVVYRAEPASSGFTTHGDAIWWGFVTFTTVGYGDLVPETSLGRTAAVTLMIGGVALIGLLAGSLAEFLTDSDGQDDAASDVSDPTPDNPETAVGNSTVGGDDRVLQEVLALRAEIAELRAAVSGSNAAEP